jgi:ADP-heptose:LPS heptosyltransferase
MLIIAEVIFIENEKWKRYINFFFQIFTLFQIIRRRAFDVFLNFIQQLREFA